MAGITNFDGSASFCYNIGEVVCTYKKNWAYGITAGGAISNSFSYVTGKDIALAPNTLAEGKVITADIGGTAGTKEFTQAVIARL